jgi:putative Mg2+ transporter-C (MgtC) family protein
MEQSVWHIDSLEMILRLVASLILGGLIGWEREYSNHSAGFRTHLLVCLGSTLIMLLSIYGFSQFANEPNVRMDPARLAAQVISGIGFLGAGTIFRTGLTVSGLTTAASLWVVAAIGLSVGAGFYMAASIATMMVLIILWILNIVEKKYMPSQKANSLQITIQDKPGVIAAVQKVIVEAGLSGRKITLQEHDSDGMLLLSVIIKTAKRKAIPLLLEKIKGVDGCVSVSYAEGDPNK